MKSLMKNTGLQSLFIFLSIFFTAYANSYAADNTSIIGFWRTYDLQGNARSIVQFYQSNDQFYAVVVKDLMPSPRKTPCVDPQFPGKMVVRNLKLKDINKWTDGLVLDPDACKVYPLNVSLINHGATMAFHPYVGTPILGTTVNWQRVNNPQ